MRGVREQNGSFWGGSFCAIVASVMDREAMEIRWARKEKEEKAKRRMEGANQNRGSQKGNR